MKKKISPILIFLSAVFFSCGGFFVKSIPWGPFAISAGRACVAAIIIFIYMKLSKHKIVISKSVILCSICVAMASYFWTIASKLTTAAAAIVLEFTSPVFIILFSLIFFRKKPTKLDVIVVPIILCGVVCFFFDSLMATSTAPNPFLGNLFGILSGMSYAIVFMMKMMPKSDSLSSILLGCILCAIVGSPAVISELGIPGHADAKVLVMVLLMGTIQFAAAYICLGEGLDHTPAFAASLISTIEPIMNPLLTAVIVHETLGVLSIVGSVIVIGCILCYNLLTIRKESQTTQTTEEAL